MCVGELEVHAQQGHRALLAAAVGGLPPPSAGGVADRRGRSRSRGEPCTLPACMLHPCSALQRATDVHSSALIYLQIPRWKFFCQECSRHSKGIQSHVPTLEWTMHCECATRACLSRATGDLSHSGQASACVTWRPGIGRAAIGRALQELCSARTYAPERGLERATPATAAV
jgi:hypothetical protein